MTPTTLISTKPSNVEAHCEGDLLVVRIRGSYDASVARHLESIYVELADRYGYRLALLHAHEITTITPEARQLIAHWNAVRQDPAAGAVVGASFTGQALARLLVRAIELITRKPSDIGFFNDEASARVWLDKQRIRLAQMRAPKR